MVARRDNYQIQLAQAQKRFLTYDQQKLIDRCRLRYDENYLYARFLAEEYRICRSSGRMERLHRGNWVDGNGFGEVMTILDWLCDSRRDRFISGRWINVVSQSHAFHSNLQEGRDANAELFDKNPEAFSKACQALGGEKQLSGDMAYAIELVDGLRILVQLWYSDEEFPAQLRCFWDENVIQYIRYETTWYAIGVLMERIRENMV